MKADIKINNFDPVSLMYVRHGNPSYNISFVAWYIMMGYWRGLAEEPK